MEADNSHSSNPGSGEGAGSDRLASSWLSRIKEGQKRKDKWAKKAKCDKLEQYYLGEQWEPSGTNYEPYVINLIFSTIEIKLPTLLFDEPVFHVKPKPSGYAYDIEMASKRAQLREDLLNTIITNPELKFGNRIELSILDSFFRFGIIEVGYSANWVLNPNADQPILRSDGRPYVDSKKNVIRQPAELPESEQIYIKRIHAKRFVVGGIEGEELETCNWSAYWEWARVEDLKSNKALKNLDKLTWSGARSSDFVPEEYGPEIDHLMKTGDLCKVWHLWDHRKKVNYLVADNQEVTLYEKKFERLPLFDLRPHRLTEGWYPLPPVRNWKPAQDEINDSHEQLRNHRKRFTRKYLYNSSAFPDEEEIDKIINGGDGTFVKTSSSDVRLVAMPLQNADLGAQATQSLGVDKDDFNIISGTPEEQQLQADRSTATQSNIINQRAQIRDSRQRIQIAKWLARIGREILLLAEEKFTLPIWVKMSVPLGDVKNYPDITSIWHQITTNDLKKHNEETDDFENDFDFDVGITLDSMSPIANDNERDKFLLFLGVLNQYPEISTDPLLVREAAYKCGYRNEKVIARLQQAAQMMLIQKMEQAGGSPGGMQPNQMAQQQVAQQTPPNLDQIRNQIQGMGIQ